MEQPYNNQLSDDHLDRIQAGLRERGLISWQDLNLHKVMEDIKPSDLDIWIKICEQKGIDPERVVIDDCNLNYKWVAENYKFKSVYFPNELYKCQSRLINPCQNIIPETNLNFMAGNYSPARWRLLQELWGMDLLTDNTKLFWSSYRSWEQDTDIKPEFFSDNFFT